MIKFKNFLNENFLTESAVFYRADHDSGEVLNFYNGHAPSLYFIYYKARTKNGIEYFYKTNKFGAKKVSISQTDYEIAKNGIEKYIKKNPDKEKELQGRLNTYLNSGIKEKNKKDLDEYLKRRKNDIIYIDNFLNSEKFKSKFNICKEKCDSTYNDIKKQIEKNKDVFKNSGDILDLLEQYKNKICDGLEKISNMKEENKDAFVKYQKNKKLENNPTTIKRVFKKLNSNYHKIRFMFDDLKKIQKENFPEILDKVNKKLKDNNIEYLDDVEDFIFDIDDYSSSMEDFFNDRVISKIKDNYGEDFVEKINESLQLMPKIFKNIFKVYGKKLFRVNIDDDNENEYDEDDNTINLNNYIQPRTFFHEFGHLIDHNSFNRQRECYSYYSKLGEDFVDTLMKESENIFKKRHDDFVNMKLEDYYAKYIPNGYNEHNFNIECYKDLKKQYDSGEDVEKYINFALNDLFESEIYNEDFIKHNDTTVNDILEDIISMSSQGKRDFQTHKQHYIHLFGGNSYHTTSEAFAEFTETFCLHNENIKILDKYFPRSIKLYKNMIKRISDAVTNDEEDDD